MGAGFDSMWTDMSEIVRPTRDGIHGREYINTSVDLGRKAAHFLHPPRRKHAFDSGFDPRVEVGPGPNHDGLSRARHGGNADRYVTVCAPPLIIDKARNRCSARNGAEEPR